jgi:peptidoglycan/LPS O-acetylase OafA/YrhL
MDGLRFLAFLGVFIYHAFGELFRSGALGVHVFFALSGFLITRILLFNESQSVARDLGVFYSRRVLRIFPLYYGVLVYLLLWRGQLPHPVWQFLYAQNFISFSQGRFVSPAHFWTLCVEEQFYLTFPFILALVPRSQRLLGIIALIAASVATAAVVDYLFPANRITFVLLPTSAHYLLWGGLAGYLDVSGLAKKLPATSSLAAGCGLFLVAAYMYLIGADQVPGPAASLRLVVGIACSLIVFGLWRTSNRPALRIMSFGPVVYLGRISYGLYVYHGLSFHWANRLQSLPIPGFGLLQHLPPAVAVFLITVIISALSWHLYESPINNLKRYIPYRRAAAGPTKASAPATPLAARRPAPSESCVAAIHDNTPE